MAHEQHHPKSPDTSSTPVVVPPRGESKHLGNRRVAVLHNGEIHLGEELYAVPDPEVMEAISGETRGRVIYLPPGPVEGGAGQRGEPLFAAAVYRPFLRSLLQRFHGQEIALRAIMTSVNGTLEDVMGPGKDVLDIADTFYRGQEKEGNFNVQAVSAANGASEPGVDDALFSTKYISSYSSRVGFSLRYEVDPTDKTPQDFAECIFPAILVYDTNGLRATGEDRFTATLKDGYSPQDVLLGAYVLSRPG